MRGAITEHGDGQPEGGAGRSGALVLVGIGPGDPALLTRRAEAILRKAEAVFGYSLYLDLLRPLLPDLDYRPSAITQEEARARAAVDLALSGRRVALVGSGDAGVYGLAGLALEILEARDAADLPVEVVPGVTAALSAAALLGAPLGHDFCAISLSHLLTPWATIRARLEAAAAADFVTVLYNPASERRRTQLPAACRIFLAHRDPATPVGLVANAYRAGERVRLSTLAALATEPVDMLTTVVIGNRSTRRWRDRLITPRGYGAVPMSGPGVGDGPGIRPPADIPMPGGASLRRLAPELVVSEDRDSAGIGPPPGRLGEAPPGLGGGGPIAGGPTPQREAASVAAARESAHSAVLLIGHGSKDAEGEAAFRAFAQAVERISGEPAQAAFLEFNEPPIPEAARRCIVAGARRITALPLFLGAATHQKNDVPTAINWLRGRYPDVAFDYGAPLGAHAGIAEAMAARAADAIAAAEAAGSAPIAPGETALLLVGRGSRDPDSNGELYKAGRLIYEGGRFGLVEACFIAIAAPDMTAGVERCVRLGARRIVLAPYMLFTGVLTKRMERLGRELSAAYPGVQIVSAAPLGGEPRVLNVVIQRIAEARAGLAQANCDTCKYRVRMSGFEHEFGLAQGSDHNHGLRGTAAHVHAHGARDAAAELLPTGD